MTCTECKTVTAYEDSKGQIHTTKTGCEQANAKYKKEKKSEELTKLFRANLEHAQKGNFSPYDLSGSYFCSGVKDQLGYTVKLLVDDPQCIKRINEILND